MLCVCCGDSEFRWGRGAYLGQAAVVASAALTSSKTRSWDAAAVCFSMAGRRSLQSDALLAQSCCRGRGSFHASRPLEGQEPSAQVKPHSKGIVHADLKGKNVCRHYMEAY